MDIGLGFGKVLRKLRKRAGLTQEQLGQEANLQRNYVSLMERGINQPTITTLFKLAKALNCPVSQIIIEVEESINKLDY